MKILFLCTHLNVGGVGSYIVNLARGLNARDHQVLAASSGGGLVCELEGAGIRHLYVDIKTKSELSPKLIPAFFKLRSLIKREDIRIIHSHTRVTQVLGTLLAKSAAIGHIATCHGFFKARLGRRLFNCWGDKTIAISDAVRDHLVDDLNAKKENVELVYNGVELERFNRKFAQDEIDSIKKELGLGQNRVIGSIGRLSPVKGYKYLIEAFKLLLERHQDVELLLVGDGPDKLSLRESAKRLGLEDKVKFIGPRRDIDLILRAM
ncbi:MAG: glycosyltransferase, partial [Candidatus Omnitrophota bacterium]